MIYSWDLSEYEEGRFIATRYPDSCAVGGDWVCRARSNSEAIELADAAAFSEWAAPATRDPGAWTVEFRDCHGFDAMIAGSVDRPALKDRT